MWKRKRKAEWLPWYRVRNYKGDLTEAEKRQLDAFRMQPKHPAADLDDLPEEVRLYIIGIDVELDELKQALAFGRCLVLSGIGAAQLYLNYKGCVGAPTIWSYALWALVLVLPWFLYSKEWHKNAEAFLPSDHSHRPINEAIRQEWELEYVVRARKANENATSPKS
jgi:hypothetical protein